MKKTDDEKCVILISDILAAPAKKYTDAEMLMELARRDINLDKCSDRTVDLLIRVAME